LLKRSQGISPTNSFRAVVISARLTCVSKLRYLANSSSSLFESTLESCSRKGNTQTDGIRHNYSSFARSSKPSNVFLLVIRCLRDYYTIGSSKMITIYFKRFLLIMVDQLPLYNDIHLRSPWLRGPHKITNTR